MVNADSNTSKVRTPTDLSIHSNHAPHLLRQPEELPKVISMLAARGTVPLNDVKPHAHLLYAPRFAKINQIKKSAVSNTCRRLAKLSLCRLICQREKMQQMGQCVQSVGSLVAELQ
jgi:hypothetical protein